MIPTRHERMPQSTCCGHSHTENFEFTRYKCLGCGRIVAADEVNETRHSVEAIEHAECGPVVMETAGNHAVFVEWLFEAARTVS